MPTVGDMLRMKSGSETGVLVYLEIQLSTDCTAPVPVIHGQQMRCGPKLADA
jgi:hypothetical protein